ncbi:MAG: polysaccharide biosynthesis/export family protein, partial [Verrucomicrobiales bacterium]
EGKTWNELANEIHQKYVPAYYRRLTVNVSSPDRFYTVDGEVRSPGHKNYFGQITILKAIAAAGGFTDFANKTSVEVTRQDGTKHKINTKKALKNPALDLPIYPGDSVFVDRRFW